MQSPFISVIIPVYNTERYIAEAIRSVLAQGYSNLEIIVVNDGSTDGTAGVLASFGDSIRVITQDNHGQAHARNRGLREAKGSIIGFLDGDDMWPADHISATLPFLVEADYDFVRGMVQYVRDVDTDHETRTEKIYMDALVGAGLYKRTVIDTVGLFDETMRQGEDFDWHVRISEGNFKEKRIEDVMLFYRRHENNITNSKETIKIGQLAAFRRKLARARSRETHV